MVDSYVCPKCGDILKVLDGKKPHPNSWYCVSETLCGWQSWNQKTRSERNNDRDNLRAKILQGNRWSMPRRM